MIDNTYKEIIVGYTENHTRDRYKLYNPENKRIITTRDVEWAEWKANNPVENLKMFHDRHKEYLVPGI